MKFKDLNEAKLKFDSINELDDDQYIFKKDFKSGKNWITLEVIYDLVDDTGHFTIGFRTGSGYRTDQNTIISDPKAILQVIDFVKQFCNGSPDDLDTDLLHELSAAAD